MVQAMLKYFHDLVVPAATEPEPPPAPAEEVHKVGAYIADYAPLTPKEMAMSDDACEELFKRSRPVSR